MENNRQPLYWLNNLEKGAVLVEAFNDKQVRDLVARAKVCYVLCGSRENGHENREKQPDKPGARQELNEPTAFIAEVFSSPNLEDWTLEARLSMPALPNALEVTGEAFFIGLANSRPWRSADIAAGNIYRLERAAK